MSPVPSPVLLAPTLPAKWKRNTQSRKRATDANSSRDKEKQYFSNVVISYKAEKKSFVMGGFNTKKVVLHEISEKSKAKIRKRLFLDSILFSFFFSILFSYFWFQIHFKTKNKKDEGEAYRILCDRDAGGSLLHH
ncbi:hypothetical protein V6Z11_A05G243900 [Gossypium hirsutum]